MFLRYKFIILSLFLFISNILIAQEYISPRPIGGEKQLKDFINSELEFPEKALNNKVKDYVVINFFIEADGKVNIYSVLKSVSPEVDEEALRIFKKILWKPAIFMGNAIAHDHKFEINFNYNRYKKICRKRGYDKTIYPFLPVDTSNIIYSFKKVEIIPKAVFQNKNLTINKFIANKIEYPQAAKQQGLTGTVKLSFIVENSGRISHILVSKHLGAGCDEEAVRLLKLIKWTPGIEKGKAVRVKMVLDVTFNLYNKF